ncbi:MAG: OadG family protein [Desulfobacteraceae bacterium]
MQGLAAISAQNGWAMAATGACIVITGLAVLSFIISQLHRILGLFEKPEKAVIPAPVPEEAKTPAVETTVDVAEVLSDLKAAASLHQSVSKELGETFELAQLYKAIIAANLPHPHITVRELRNAGYLAKTEEGTFSWKNI